MTNLKLLILRPHPLSSTFENTTDHFLLLKYIILLVKENKTKSRTLKALVFRVRDIEDHNLLHAREENLRQISCRVGA